MRRAAWWRDRVEATLATTPVLQPPARPDPDDDAEPQAHQQQELPGEVAEAVVAWGGVAEQECLRVTGVPRQGAARLATGCELVCSECGVAIAASLTVVAADEGWCVATVCGCAVQPFFTRESDFHPSAEAAWEALDRGDYAVSA